METSVATRLAETEADLERQRDLMRQLLERAGTRDRCKACDAEIYFVTHLKTQRAGVYNPDGLTHYATCSDPDKFRRKYRS